MIALARRQLKVLGALGAVDLRLGGPHWGPGCASLWGPSVLPLWGPGGPLGGPGEGLACDPPLWGQCDRPAGGRSAADYLPLTRSQVVTEVPGTVRSGAVQGNEIDLKYSDVRCS